MTTYLIIAAYLAFAVAMGWWLSKLSDKYPDEQPYDLFHWNISWLLYCTFGGKVFAVNIIDAIKSGKFFSRLSNPGKSYLFIDYENDLIEFSAAELLADDWEIESQPVTITREQFDAAWDRARTKKLIGLEIMNSFCERDDLAKELGL